MKYQLQFEIDISTEFEYSNFVNPPKSYMNKWKPELKKAQRHRCECMGESTHNNEAANYFDTGRDYETNSWINISTL